MFAADKLCLQHYIIIYNGNKYYMTSAICCVDFYVL